MPERIKVVVTQFIIPILVFVFALGAASYKLDQKEDVTSHAEDIQRLKEQQSATYSLVLDMRCDLKPNDRRCKG